MAYPVDISDGPHLTGGGAAVAGERPRLSGRTHSRVRHTHSLTRRASHQLRLRPTHRWAPAAGPPHLG
eukprot:7380851-Prymnesium_polylepis.2